MHILHKDRKTINKSDLIGELSSRYDMVHEELVDESVRVLIELMVDTLANDGRVEIRGFGSFCLHHRKARTARNPRTGDRVKVSAKAVPYFKPGKALREAVDYE